MKPGPKPAGERALTAAERQARLRAKRAAGAKPVHYRRPTDRRSRPQLWEDAVNTLSRCLDAYQHWRDSLPENLAEAAIRERLDELLELREHVEVLRSAELPKGFGRDARQDRSSAIRVT
jgi:hypothetical protein